MPNQQLLTPLHERPANIPKSDEEIVLTRVRAQTAGLFNTAGRLVVQIKRLYSILSSLDARRKRTEDGLAAFTSREMAELRQIGTEVFRRFEEMGQSLSGRESRLAWDKVVFAGLRQEQVKTESFLLKEKTANAADWKQISQARDNVIKTQAAIKKSWLEAQAVRLETAENNREAWRLFNLRKRQFDDFTADWKKRFRELEEREALAVFNAKRIAAATDTLAGERQKLADREKLLKDREGMVNRKLVLLKKHGVVL